MITVESISEKLEEKGLIQFITPESIDSLCRFTRRMLEFNENINLTNFKDDEDVLYFHILDSFYALPVIKKLIRDPSVSYRWMDLGSGCGFPGVSLLAAYPNIDLTLMDATNKKITVLKACLESARWDARTLNGRAEELGRNVLYRESFDGVVARAVADLPVLLEYAIPLIKPGGHLVSWMTESQIQFVNKSKNALDALNSKIVEKSPYSLMDNAQGRYILVVEKRGKTSSHYPRSVGIPEKNPL